TLQSKVTEPDVGGLVQLVLAQAAAAGRFAELVARAVAPVLAHLARDAPLGERAITEAVTRAVSPGDLAALARELHAFDADLRGPVGFEGDLAIVPLCEVLQLLRLQ